MLQKLIDWLKRKPATKAAYLSVFVTMISLFIVSIQTFILNKQTNLAKNQLNLLSNQIQNSTRPCIDVQLFWDTKGHDTIKISNKGEFNVVNFRIQPIYFVLTSNHGWFVSTTSSAFILGDVNAKKNDSIDISGLNNLYSQPPIPDTPFIVSEYLNFLVSFSRESDGKNYLWILTGNLYRKNGVSLRIPEGVEIGGAVGIGCDDALAITLEYLKRRPLRVDYELYNSTYDISKDSTCLGNQINF